MVKMSEKSKKKRKKIFKSKTSKDKKKRVQLWFERKQIKPKQRSNHLH